jgi:signal peptidase II
MALSLLTVGCDQSTKLFALLNLQESPLALPWGVELTYAENRDMAFGLLAGVLGPEQRLFLLSTVKMLAVIGATVWLVVRRTTSTLSERLGVALVLSGALGNLIDRLRLGFVVDFLKVPYWPVFNVADVAIVVGMGLVLLSQWRSGSLAEAGS